MKRKRLALLYWLLVLSGLVIYLLQDGWRRKNECVQVKRKVVNQVYVRKYYGGRRKTGSKDVPRPQIIYPVGDSVYMFVDHAIPRETGSVVTILYKKTNPQEAGIYTWLFWVDSGIIVPVLIISGFLFSMIWISISDYGRKPVALKGHFTHNAEEKS